MAQTVIELVENASQDFASLPAMKNKVNGKWESIDWAEYGHTVHLVGRAFLTLGVQPGDGVAIIGYNRPPWIFSMMGAIYARAVPAGIYTTCSPDQCHYIAEHCDATVAVVENQEHLDKFLEIRERLPKLKAIVMMYGSHPDSMVYSWEDFLALSEQTSEESLQASMDAVDAEDVAELVYTSGTTGNPKGVMITHRNIAWGIRSFLDQFEPTLRTAFDGQLPQDAKTGYDLISYLPLCHVAEQAVTVFAPLVLGGTVWFAESLEKLGENLGDARPHMFLGVPRVWEKIQARMLAVGASATPMQKKIIAWAKQHGTRYTAAIMEGRQPPLLTRIVTEKLLGKVRQKLGLDRSIMQFSGAAPIARDTLEYFASLGIPIYEAYGMSETSGAATASQPGCAKVGTVGVALNGSEIKIADDGEILMRGGHIFKGYLKNEEATRETIDEDGWLHSGDIGVIDEDGFLKITDRKKEILITAGGENISPTMIEGQLKSIDMIDQAVVIGDQRKFLTALLVLDEEGLAENATVVGSDAKDMAAAAQCEKFKAHVEAEVERINQGLARVQTIKRWVLLPRPLSEDHGELTPTMKLKRRIVNENFAAEIESLYADA